MYKYCTRKGCLAAQRREIRIIRRELMGIVPRGGQPLKRGKELIAQLEGKDTSAAELTPHLTRQERRRALEAAGLHRRWVPLKKAPEIKLQRDRDRLQTLYATLLANPDASANDIGAALGLEVRSARKFLRRVGYAWQWVVD